VGVIHLSRYFLTDSRVCDGFERLAFGVVAENEFAQRTAVELSICLKVPAAKVLGNFRQSRLAGFHNHPRGQVGVDNHDALGSEPVGQRGFPTANATGDTDSQHISG
jgi:hypothetical protein